MVNRLRNRAGQAAIEMVLVMALVLGASVFIGNEFRTRGFIASLVSTPWKSLAGMIQNGVWGPSQETMSQHPNSFSRVTSPEGDPIQ